MSNLEVLFEVPKWIEKGLASGVLKRIGGVIVENGTKQVVAWLRDGSGVNNLVNVATGIPSPFALLLTAARGAITLWDGKMTRDAVGIVGSQVAQVAQQVVGVSQQLNIVTALSTFTVSGQVLNLGLSAATFYATMKRLDKLSDEVAKLSQVIQAEFNRDRDIRFKRALQAARDVFESENAVQRDQATRSAVDGLFEARENFLLDFEQSLKTDGVDSQLQLARHSLIRAMYAEISRIRCYIAANDLNLAKQRLSEDIPFFKTHSRSLISKLLGEHPAVFLHKDVLPQDMDRFLQIQRWMYNDDPFTHDDDAKMLFNIFNDLRSDFWNTSVIQDGYINKFQQMARRSANTVNNRVSKMTDRLSEAEVIIENYERLIGFELELRSLRLSFQSWESLVPENEIAENGLGIIFDSEVAERLNRLQ